MTVVHWHFAILTIKTVTGHLDFHCHVRPVHHSHGMVKITLDDDQTLLKPPDICNRQWILMKSCHLTAMFVITLQLPLMSPS